jgi:benzylsuccinate CoA-transferase BbsF subunit
MPSFLTGTRVLSLTTGIAGPNAARTLANYGAEVIKIESRAGGIDAFRAYGDDPNASPRFLEVNLNTRSLTLNLKQPAGIQLMKELVACSDVVMENFRPDVMPRLGLGPDDLRHIKPDLVVARMPGLGSTGPLKDYGTWGPTLNAYSGLTYLWNHPNQQHPTGSQGVYPDYLTGIMAPLVIVAALIRRGKTGEGAVLDLAQVESAAYMLGTAFLNAVVNHRDPPPLGNDWPYAAPHNCYPCSGEDRWCVIAVETDTQWRDLCVAMGRPEVSDDPRFATFVKRRHNLQALDELVGSWTHQRDAHDVMQQLQSAGVPCGVVQSGSDLAADPHLEARGFIQRVAHPKLGEMPMAGLPLHFAHGGPEPFVVPGPLGEANSYIICDLLGHSREALEQWERDQVVY